MPVTDQHPEYIEHVDEWQTVNDAVIGERAIKAGKFKYLPELNPSDDSDQNKQRNIDYRLRAIYTNFTGRTLTGLKGAAFKADPTCELPRELEYLKGDATGLGVGLVQLAKDTTGHMLAIGRAGFLVDYPPVEPGATADRTAKLRAKILYYEATAIINWRMTTDENGKAVLALLVLREQVNRSDDEFSHEYEKQYRVCRLTQFGYTQQVYVKRKEGDTSSQDEYIPEAPPTIITDGVGQPWDVIPFVFVGATNNDASVDDSPLSAMATVNIGHYRNSADVEENSHIHGQVTIAVTSDLNAEEWDKRNPDGIRVGARSGHFLGSQGEISSVQAEPSSLTQTLMLDKEQQLVMLGAQLITDKNQNQTAKAAQIQHASEHSVLGDIMGNISAALTTCIVWCGRFLGVEVAEDENVFEINKQFFDEAVDATMLSAAIQGYDREIIALPDARAYYRKAGVIDESRSDDDIEGDLEPPDPEPDPLEGDELLDNE